MTPAPARRARLRRELRSFAPLLALSGFAVAQPVLDVLGRNPELVLFRGASAADLWVLGALVVLVPPVVALLLEVVAGLASDGARRVVHGVAIAAFGAGIGAQVAARALGLDGALLVVLAVAVAAGAVAVASRATGRLWLTYAAWAPPVFLVLFAATSSSASAARAAGDVSEGVAVDDPARTVVLVLDELPLSNLLAADGTIDAGLFPGFADLASSSTWFRGASAVSNATTHAVPAILTGRFPDLDAQPVVADHPENLFTLLGDRYHLQVQEALTRLCPTDACEATAQAGGGALRALLGDAARLWQEQVHLRSASDPLAAFAEPATVAHADGWEDVSPAQPERFARFLDSFTGTPEATLHYAHVVLPHTPSRFLASGRSYPNPAEGRGALWEEPGRFFDLWSDEPWPAVLGRQRALLQTQYADRLVAAMVAELREHDLWDDALVVVVADHGRAFQPGQPARALAPDVDPTPVLPEVLGVPLLVKVPGQREAAVSDANVQAVDVLPTIADVLGVEVPWALDGTSAFAPGPRPAEKTLVQELVDARLASAPGGRFTVPHEGFVAEQVDRGIHTLVPASGPMRSARVGPRADLVGRPVHELRGGPASSATVRFAGGARVEVERGAGSLPAYVVGEVDGAGDAEVAIVLDGIVAAVVRPFEWGGRSAVVAAMLPEELLTPGAHELGAHLVTGGRSPVLRPLGPG